MTGPRALIRPIPGMWAALAGVALALLAAAPAAAQPCPVTPGALTPAAIEHVQFDAVAPGESRDWLTTMENPSSSAAALGAALNSSGPLAAVIVVSLEVCSVPWSGTATRTCGGSRSVALEATTVATTIDVTLPDLAPGASWFGRFTGTLLSSAGNEYQGAGGSITSMVTADTGGCPGPPTTVPPTSVPPTTSAPTTAVPTSTVPTTSSPRTHRSATPVVVGRSPVAGPSLAFTGAGSIPLVVFGAALLTAGLSVLFRRAGATPTRRRHDDE